MTYEEYKKGNKNNKKNNVIKILIEKTFTIVIFSMIIIITSNTNESFRNFLVNDILNKTMDFSKVNNTMDNLSNVFESKEDKQVFKELEEKEIYKDGYKYITNQNENIIQKESGIVTFIGEKEGYGNTIIIQQSNGYYAWYGNINESIKLYDYIEQGEILGTTKDNFYYYVLLKNDIPITHEN
jgi:hypothetical protein